MQLTCNQRVTWNVASETAGNSQLMHAASQRSLDDDTLIVMDDVSICKHRCVSCRCDSATPAMDNVLNFGVWAAQQFMASLN